jgi:iron complex transport system substrate-binding protein
MKGKMLASILALCLMGGISSADFTLHVYGNADMDDVIDERDIEYARAIMDGTQDMTDLADVNGDGEVDEEDIRLIEEIIDGTAAEIKVIDSDGNSVAVKVPVERIVIYNHQCAEILQILGAEDQVAGVRDTFEKQGNRFPQISKKKNIGSGADVDIEAIVSIDPDLIIAYTFYPTKEDLEAKLPSAIPILRIDCAGGGPCGIDSIRDGVSILGYLLNAREEAARYQEWHDMYVGAVEARTSAIPEDERVRVYLESTPEGSETISSRTAIGKNHPAGNLIELAGGVNIAAGQLPLYMDTDNEYGEIETEWVLEQNPEVIVGRAMGAGVRPYENEDDSLLRAYSDQIKGLPGFDGVDAVKNDRVYIITNDHAVTPNYPSALLLLAKWFYPEIFDDLNPKEAHLEYLEMMGISKEVANKNTYYYPAVA